ncbi:HEPN domain-containing protein [Acidianus ambivalens]|uniref:HEPN domain-containing protein n=1 Tax=Acidianus ambivalens TaxID=2283 RepID=UPI001E58904A|nr:HEPN domain-containing protein [Acidianus ambivalens]
MANASAFWAQKSAEKALKALLINFGKKITLLRNYSLFLITSFCLRYVYIVLSKSIDELQTDDELCSRG